jgi:hypothetical protein
VKVGQSLDALHGCEVQDVRLDDRVGESCPCGAVGVCDLTEDDRLIKP